MRRKLPRAAIIAPLRAVGRKLNIRAIEASSTKSCTLLDAGLEFRLPVGDLGFGVPNILNKEYAAYLDQQFRAFGGRRFQSPGHVFTVIYVVR